MTFYIRIRIFDPKCFIDPSDRERAAAREPAQHGQASQFFVGKARAFFDEYDVFDADQPSFRRETGKLDVGLHGSFFFGALARSIPRCGRPSVRFFRLPQDRIFFAEFFAFSDFRCIFVRSYDGRGFVRGVAQSG